MYLAPFFRFLNSVMADCGSCRLRARQPTVQPFAQSHCADHNDIFAQAVPDGFWQPLHHNGAASDPQHEVNFNRQQPGSEPILVCSLLSIMLLSKCQRPISGL